MFYRIWKSTPLFLYCDSPAEAMLCSVLNNELAESLALLDKRPGFLPFVPASRISPYRDGQMSRNPGKIFRFSAPTYIYFFPCAKLALLTQTRFPLSEGKNGNGYIAFRR